MKKLLIIFSLVMISFGANAQLDIGGFFGTSFYMGDLNPDYPFLESNLAYGAVARYNINSRWAIRINGFKGVITGDDERSKFFEERSLRFKSSIWELGGTFEFNFLQYYTGSLKDYYTPYLFAGFALLYNRPKIGNIELREKSTEGQDDPSQLVPYEARPKYSYFNLSIPFGIGFKYSFSKRISASFEWGMRKTFSDYIDDVSTTYYQSASNLVPGTEEYNDLQFSDPNLNHEPNMQRGNSKTKDWYSFAGLTITYSVNLKNRNKCSEFQEN
ncbi:MAG: hypothetical protein JW731_03775 [Bacteroidales bacterium]|nr:hypothetical protein [Bacteroidales bacterium]